MNLISRTILKITGAASIALTTPLLALAAPVTFPNPIAAPDLTTLLTLVLNAVTLIVFPFIVLFIVYAGFKMIAAQGNPGEIEKAKQQIAYAIIGALIILGAQAISYAVKGTVDVIRCGSPGCTIP